ncbi:MAG: selenium-dependent molybdenum cofactor biosynthesis protein YqeB [Pseudomonadota bacterium]
MLRQKVLIKGAGEHASGTAHRMFRCGFKVAMTELESPVAVRRAVSFGSAVFEKEVVVQGVKGVAYDLDEASFLSSWDFPHVPIFVDPECQLKDLWKPDVIIDGRILKKNLDNSIEDAALVIGFGPGLVAGKDVQFVVETKRGHDLGKIISQGSASKNTGIPGPIGGQTKDRAIRSPLAGILESERKIGDMVEKGDLFGVVEGQEIKAAISGVIRGQLFPGSKVIAGQKLGDIDPRGDVSFCYSISDKARTISGAALEIVVSFFNRR